MTGFLSTVRGVAWRGLHVTYTNPAFALPSIIFPLFFYVAFAGGLSSVGDVPGFSYPAGYDTFQFAFVLLQASAFSGVFSGFGVAADFEQGFGRRLLLASPRREAIVVGYVLVALGRAAVTLTVLTAVALTFGMRPAGSAQEYLAVALLATVVCLAAALFACGVAMRLKTIQAGPAMQMPVFVSLFLTPVFVPLELVGGWVNAVASVNPMTALLQGERDLLGGEPVDLLLTFGTGCALAALFAAWALRGLRAAERTGG